MFKIKKLLNNMESNIRTEEAKVIRSVTQAYEDDKSNNTTQHQVRAYIDREKDILKGNKAKRSKELENLLGGWDNVK